MLLGPTGTGKTYSLKRLIQEQGERVAYINLDGKTELGFKGKKKISKFITPSSPLEVNPGVRALEEDENIEYVVIDTLSFFMDQLENQYVLTSDDSRGAWGKIYAKEIQDLMHFANNVSKKSWIIISHVQESEKPVNFVTETKCYGKGSVGKKGLESFQSIVIYSRKFECDKSETGVCYGFQVKPTRDSIGLSIKSPEDMFDSPFVDDNDILEIFKRIDSYEDD